MVSTDFAKLITLKVVNQIPTSTVVAAKEIISAGYIRTALAKAKYLILHPEIILFATKYPEITKNTRTAILYRGVPSTKMNPGYLAGPRTTAYE